MKGDLFLVSVSLIKGKLWKCYVMVMFTSVFPETYFVLYAYIVIVISRAHLINLNEAQNKNFFKVNIELILSFQ